MLVAGVLRVAAGAIGPGELIVFVSYTRKAHNPMRSMAREVTKIAAAMARADRVAELLAEDEMLEERPDAYRGARARGDVALDGVTFAYGGERPALRDLTLRMAAGARVAIMGASGAGQVDARRARRALLRPDRGPVSIDGRDVRDCALAWVREQVAIVLQDTVLFTRQRAREHRLRGRGDATRRSSARRARPRRDEFIRELPDGYDTELGPQGVGLSGGQRQRIGIARTLLRDPPILVLDEPTTGLDAASEAELLDGLAPLMAGRTTMLVTHSQGLADTADADRAARRRADRQPHRARARRSGAAQLERLLDPERDARRCWRARSATGRELDDVRRQPRRLQAARDAWRCTTAPASTARSTTPCATSIAGVDLAARAAQAALPRAGAPRRRAARPRRPRCPTTTDARRARHLAAVRPAAARARPRTAPSWPPRSACPTRSASRS